jgi:hypothetical protein
MIMEKLGRAIGKKWANLGDVPESRVLLRLQLGLEHGHRMAQEDSPENFRTIGYQGYHQFQHVSTEVAASTVLQFQ